MLLDNTSKFYNLGEPTGSDERELENKIKFLSARVPVI